MTARLDRWLLALLTWAVTAFPKVHKRLYFAALSVAIDAFDMVQERDLHAACPTCRRTWLEHRCPKDAETLAVALHAHRCDVCQTPLPVDALKTHDGRWACADHKVQP